MGSKWNEVLGRTDEFFPFSPKLVIQLSGWKGSQTAWPLIVQSLKWRTQAQPCGEAPFLSGGRLACVSLPLRERESEREEEREGAREGGAGLLRQGKSNQMKSCEVLETDGGFEVNQYSLLPPADFNLVTASSGAGLCLRDAWQKEWECVCVFYCAHVAMAKTKSISRKLMAAASIWHLKLWRGSVGVGWRSGRRQQKQKHILFRFLPHWEMNECQAFLMYQHRAMWIHWSQLRDPSTGEVREEPRTLFSDETSSLRQLAIQHKHGGEDLWAELKHDDLCVYTSEPVQTRSYQ